MHWTLAHSTLPGCWSSDLTLYPAMASTAFVDHRSPTQLAANLDVRELNYEAEVADSRLDHLVPAEQRHEPNALQNSGALLTLLAAQSSSTLTTEPFMLDTEQLWTTMVPHCLSCTVLPPFTEPEVLDSWPGEEGDEDELWDTREKAAAVRRFQESCALVEETAKAARTWAAQAVAELHLVLVAKVQVSS